MKAVSTADYLAVRPGTVVYHQGTRHELVRAYRAQGAIWWLLEDGRGGRTRTVAGRFGPSKPGCDERYRGTWGDGYAPEDCEDCGGDGEVAGYFEYYTPEGDLRFQREMSDCDMCGGLTCEGAI